jgi:GNAT superfamily N-acetyltransferase
MIGRIRTLWRKMLHMGPRYAAKQVFEMVVPEALLRVNTSIIVEADMQHDTASPAEDLTVRWASPEYLATLQGPEEELNEFRGELEHGHRIVTVEYDNNIIGSVQFNFGTVDQDSWLRYILQPNKAWSSDARVTPEHRGRGLYGLMHHLAAEDLYREGYTHKLGEVDAANKRMRQAIGKAGYIDMGPLFYVRILGFAFVRAPHFMRIGWWAFGRRCEIPLKLFDERQSDQPEPKAPH